MYSVNNLLSPESRVWVYQSEREFTTAESVIIATKVNDFVKQWTSHKLEVSGHGSLHYNRFVVLMADETQVGLGGCSVDSSVHFIRQLEKTFNTKLLDRWLIAFKQNDTIRTGTHAEFEKLVETGVITDDTIIFNNLVKTKAEFESKWHLPYKHSWLKNLSAAHTSFDSIL